MSSAALPPVVTDALAPIATQRPGGRAARRSPVPPVADTPAAVADSSPPPPPVAESDSTEDVAIVDGDLPSWLRGKPVTVSDVLLEIPVGSIVRAFPNSRVDVHLDRERSKRFHAILVGLIAKRAKLANGKPVRTNADVIRWLLDQPDLHADQNPKKSDGE